MPISQAGICSRRVKGFTLLELAVVIFIVSLFAAVVFPSFNMGGNGGIKADARRIALLLTDLNDSAIYTKGTFPLKFDFRDSSLTWQDAGGVKSETIKSLVSVTVPSQGEIREGDLTVFFGPLGVTQNIDVLLSEGGEEMKVTFNPLSGRAKITGEEEKK